MYKDNFLAHRLRRNSIDRNESCFAEINGKHQVTYKELFSQAEKIAIVLLDNGLQPGDRVAVQVEKTIEAVELYLAVVLAGGVFLPLNTAYTSREVDYFLTDAQPSIFVCSPDKHDALVPVATSAGVRSLFTLDGFGNGSLTDSAQATLGEFVAVPRDADDLASILYTSGTTGRSKGAMLSHGNLATNATVLSDYWHFTQEDVLIHALPIFHIHGLYVAINVTLVAGSSMLFHNRFDAAAILQDMKRASVLMGVPTFYVRLLSMIELNVDSVANMRLFVSGSAPLLTETHREWHERTGHSILERYGMTETNMNASNPYIDERREGTVGLPLPGVDIVIADPATGRVLPVGETGSIEIKGPNVFQGYWNMPDKTAEEFRDNGFFITGDLGCYDTNGYLSIVGRSKDMIISGGYNVYPKEIELLIDDLDEVEESAVIGLPHPDFGEAVAAVVVVKAKQLLDPEILTRKLGDSLARFKQPKAVFVVKELPRNTMGKVQKNHLREQYQDVFMAEAKMSKQS
ncbi:MAG: malonate--CoA ligase [Arenicella sp.]